MRAVDYDRKTSKNLIRQHLHDAVPRRIHTRQQAVLKQVLALVITLSVLQFSFFHKFVPRPNKNGSTLFDAGAYQT